MSKKYLNLTNGFYRFNNGFEINWCLRDWALPIGVDFNNDYLIFIQVLFVRFIIPVR